MSRGPGDYCKTCAFYESERPITGRDTGTCHRNAPAPEHKFGTVYWPRTNDTDWCGEFVMAGWMR